MKQIKNYKVNGFFQCALFAYANGQTKQDAIKLACDTGVNLSSDEKDQGIEEFLKYLEN